MSTSTYPRARQIADLPPPQEFTSMQRTVLEQRIDSIMRDFPVDYLLVSCKGLMLQRGIPPSLRANPVKPVEKKKKARTLPPGYVLGSLTRLTEPWLQLLVASPDEILRLRLADLETKAGNKVVELTLTRFLSALSAKAINLYGKGCLTTQQVYDPELKELVALARYNKVPVVGKERFRLAPYAAWSTLSPLPNKPKGNGIGDSLEWPPATLQQSELPWN